MALGARVRPGRDGHVAARRLDLRGGNCAAIFGDVFQLLDRDADGVSEYPIQPSSEWARWLDREVPECDAWRSGRLRRPGNLYLWATMNTSDQSLFPMDTAFRRRWGMEHVGIRSANKRALVGVRSGGPLVPWSELMQPLNAAIVAHTRSDDEQMGPWFIKAPAGARAVPSTEFKSKVLFYRWNDVFRDQPEHVFRSNITTYDQLNQRYEAGNDVFVAVVRAAVREAGEDAADDDAGADGDAASAGDADVG